MNKMINFIKNLFSSVNIDQLRDIINKANLIHNEPAAPKEPEVTPPQVTTDPVAQKPKSKQPKNKSAK